MELGYNTVGLIRKFESIGIYPLYHRCALVKYPIIENISSLEVYGFIKPTRIFRSLKNMIELIELF